MFTIFFDNESNILPIDFTNLKEAEEYAENILIQGLAFSYKIEFTEGDVV